MMGPGRLRLGFTEQLLGRVSGPIVQIGLATDEQQLRTFNFGEVLAQVRNESGVELMV